jgi:hypothetical protein
VDLSGSHRAQTGRNANFVESIGAKPLHEESVLVRGNLRNEHHDFVPVARRRDSIRRSMTCFLALILSAQAGLETKQKRRGDFAAF